MAKANVDKADKADKLDKVAQLEAAQVLLESEIDELKDDLKRVQADFVNYKRRAETERLEIFAAAKLEVIKVVLPILDNIDRGLAHLPEELADNPWAQGVAQVAKQAEELLKSLGIDRIVTLGEPFNPHEHEAISHDGEGETVVEELQPGYRIGEKVMRPAIVKVGKLDEQDKQEKK